MSRERGLRRVVTDSPSVTISVVWLLLSVGNTQREHPRPQRQQVHRDERVQRGHHVHHRGCCLLPDTGPAQRAVLHRGPGHHLLQHDHSLPGVCTKGTCLCLCPHEAIAEPTTPGGGGTQKRTMHTGGKRTRKDPQKLHTLMTPKLLVFTLVLMLSMCFLFIW